MAISLKITRTLLSLADLELVGANGYEVISDTLQPGQVIERRDWAKSPFVAGAALLSSVEDIATGHVDVEIAGSSAADTRTKATTVIAAFKQLTYTLTFDKDGTSWSWACFKADRTMDWNFPFYLGNLTIVSFDFPRQPTALTGPY